MKNLKLISLIVTLIVVNLMAFAGTYQATFTASYSETNTTGGIYGLFYTPTNDTSNPIFIGQCNEGQTNIIFSTGTNGGSVNININPVYLFATYQVGKTSSLYSNKFLFDTNDYSVIPVPPTTPVTPKLGTPTILGIKQLN